MSDTEPVGGCYASSSTSFSCIKGEHFCVFPIIQISSFLSLASLCFFTFAKICKYKYMLTILKVIGTLKGEQVTSIDFISSEASASAINSLPVY